MHLTRPGGWGWAALSVDSISQHRAPLGAGICQLRLTVEDFSSEDRIGGGEMAMGGWGQGPGDGF